MGVPVGFLVVVAVLEFCFWPQSISQGMCGLHIKIIESTASLAPSEGVIS